MCSRCFQRHPDLPFVRGETILTRLNDPPVWLDDFVAHLAARHSVGRACTMITDLGRLLTDEHPNHPQALLERARRPGRSPGTLAKNMEGFFLAHGIAVGLDQTERLAAGRRQRRLAATPAPLRATAIRFTESCLQARVRSLRAGTRPRTDATIESHLAIVRDLAIFRASNDKHDWAMVDVHDVERFVQTRPAARKKHLTVLRHFFGWARTHRIVLIDPTKDLQASGPRGFRGPTLTLAEQRDLFRRWTTNAAIHPHEATVGLLALLHGATSAELRSLQIADINPDACHVRLGSRPHPTPLDPPSWNAVAAALAHRDRLQTANPHLLVTKQTKSTTAPASAYYLSHVLDGAAVRPRILRSTRLVELVTDLDPKLVAAAFGMRPEGVLIYLADHVDDPRLPNP